MFDLHRTGLRAGIALLASAASLVGLSGCSSDDPAASTGSGAPGGSVVLTISGEALALGGYPFPAAADGVAVVDGWQLEFEELLVTVDRITLSESPDLDPGDQSRTGPVVAQVDGPWVVDLHEGGPIAGKGGADEQAVELARLDDQNKNGGAPFTADTRYAFGFDVVAATKAAKNVNLDAQGLADHEEMQQKGYSVLYVGTATWKGEGACTPADPELDRLPRKVKLRLGFAAPTAYSNCQNPDNDPADPLGGEEHLRGVTVRANQAVTAQLTLHTDHPRPPNHREAPPRGAPRPPNHREAPPRGAPRPPNHREAPPTGVLRRLRGLRAPPGGARPWFDGPEPPPGGARPWFDGPEPPPGGARPWFDGPEAPPGGARPWFDGPPALRRGASAWSRGRPGLRGGVGGARPRQGPRRAVRADRRRRAEADPVARRDGSAPPATRPAPGPDRTAALPSRHRGEARVPAPAGAVRRRGPLRPARPPSASEKDWDRRDPGEAALEGRGPWDRAVASPSSPAPASGDAPPRRAYFSTFVTKYSLGEHRYIECRSWR